MKFPLIFREAVPGAHRSVGKILLGIFVGVTVGSLGTLAYTYLEDGARIAVLQTQLHEINSETVVADAHEKIAQGGSADPDSVTQLLKENDDLHKQIDDLKQSISDARNRQVSPQLLAQAMRDMNSRDSLNSWRGFLLEQRLNLTPAQEASLTAILGADQSADKLYGALKTVLTPDQQAEYQKLQISERESRAESLASVQVSKVATLLQLSDEQVDQAMNAIYQAQAAATAGARSNDATQGSAIESAFAKVLTSDQLAIYQHAPK